MKNIFVFGSTGSIGKQTLEIARQNKDKIKIIGLACGSNIDLLAKQIKEFEPRIAIIENKELANKLKNDFCNTKIYSGKEILKDITILENVELAVIAFSGFFAIQTVLSAIKAKVNIAIATKEVLVSAGELVMQEIKKNKLKLLPIDSEHSAILQCLVGSKKKELSQVILTASGGPFLNLSPTRLKNITVKDALSHPNWQMGRKISIDSATMMNKGLELIEAKWLFGLKNKQLNSVIHPQSIVHSMTKFIDGSVIAQLSLPSMLLPIQYALGLPKRWLAKFPTLDFSKNIKLEFMPIDLDKFPCLKLAISAMSIGGTMPTVMNAANEKAVELFLKEKISFLDIAKLIEKVMSKHKVSQVTDITELIELDKWAKKMVLEQGY